MAEQVAAKFAVGDRVRDQTTREHRYTIHAVEWKDGRPIYAVRHTRSRVVYPNVEEWLLREDTSLETKD